MPRVGPEERYGSLPPLSESIAQRLVREVEEFAEAVKHDLDGAVREVEGDLRWLEENKDYLGRAVEAAIDSALSIVEDELTHRRWVELRTFLLKGVLLALQGLNWALKESK